MNITLLFILLVFTVLLVVGYFIFLFYFIKKLNIILELNKISSFSKEIKITKKYFDNFEENMKKKSKIEKLILMRRYEDYEIKEHGSSRDDIEKFKHQFEDLYQEEYINYYKKKIIEKISTLEVEVDKMKKESEFFINI